MIKRSLLISLAVLAVTIAPAAAATPAAAPVSSGTLHITGTLRDGATVTATGLSWRPTVPAGARLLSFDVGYTWSSCSKPQGPCVTAADSTSAPFAARSYIVGHAATGKYLRLTETATQVIETDPATFTFKVRRTSHTVTSSRVVRPYASGHAPVVRFINGTPPARTGSNQELFQVSAGNFATADGVPVVTYRIDSRGWQPLPAKRVFGTGKLGVGRHAVTVRTSNGAGTTSKRFAWQVTPLPKPQACAPAASCWYPQHLD